MKFRMAPNSLFAVLLRSRWWISLLVALGVGLVARAIVPAPYGAVAMLAGFPFLVIAGIAGWRQWRAPSPARVQRTLDAAGALGFAAFVDALAEGFRADGATVTPHRGAGADLRVQARSGQVTLVSARRWKAARHGAEPLRELRAAIKAANADSGAYVALAELTDQARSELAAGGLRLIDGPALAALLHGHVPAPPR